MNGILVVDKPSGLSSHDVVARVRRLFGTKRVGHTGTLDPLATGVLVLCLGSATRIAEYLTASRKTYVAGIVFGVTTDSQDVTGTVMSEADAGGLTREALDAVLPRFRGRIEQIPPMVSAVHHEGKRLYELARKGIEVERKTRDVEIYHLEINMFAPGERARAELTVECSAGTYIRTLAADIGAALGVGAMMDSLLRTRSGGFTLDDAYSLDQLQALQGAGKLAAMLRGVADALPDWPRIALSNHDKDRVRHGQPIQRYPNTKTWERGDLGLLLDESGDAIGIGRAGDDQIAPVKLFVMSDK